MQVTADCKTTELFFGLAFPPPRRKIRAKESRKYQFSKDNLIYINKYVCVESTITCVRIDTVDSTV